ncbi:MAG TPA: hypothetical protein VFD27_04340 [Chthoniobacteraceae bacterium]|nr:hypothetical protein [Chthoniobacteraceae bacterium]
MAFDPAQPAANSALASQVMRDQLTALKALIDARGTLAYARRPQLAAGSGPSKTCLSGCCPLRQSA